jgi:hypothetical protein
LFLLFATVVVDTKGKIAASIIATGGKIATGINTPVVWVAKFATGVVDCDIVTGGAP